MGKKKGGRRKGGGKKVLSLTTFLGDTQYGDADMAALPQGPQQREDGDLDEYGRLVRRSRDEMGDDSRADGDNAWRRGGPPAQPEKSGFGTRSDMNESDHRSRSTEMESGTWKRGGGVDRSPPSDRDGGRSGGGGGGRSFGGGFGDRRGGDGGRDGGRFNDREGGRFGGGSSGGGRSFGGGFGDRRGGDGGRDGGRFDRNDRGGNDRGGGRFGGGGGFGGREERGGGFGSGGRFGGSDRGDRGGDRYGSRDREERGGGGGSRPRLQLQRRTLPMQEKAKSSSMTLGEAFAKKIPERKPRANPFGDARPVNTVSKPKSEQEVRKPAPAPRASPFGAAKPGTQTRDVWRSNKPAEQTTKPTNAWRRSNKPVVEKVETQAEDTKSSEPKAAGDNDDDEDEDEDEDLPVTVDVVDLAAPVSKGYTPDVSSVAVLDDDSESSQWESSQKKDKSSKAKAPARGKAVPKNSRWNREEETTSNDAKKAGGSRWGAERAERRQPAPRTSNSRWDKKEDAVQPSAPRGGRERAAPMTNSRWAGGRDETKPAPTEPLERPAPTRNSRWARTETEGTGSVEPRREREEERSPPQMNSRWGGGDRDRDREPRRNLEPPVARNSRWGGGDREQRERMPELEPPTQTSNSRWKEGGNRDAPTGCSNPPVAGNSRWGDEASGRSSAPAPVERERTEKEKEIDARIAAIRAKNKAGKASSSMDPFGRPLTEAQRAARKAPTPAAKPAAAPMVAPQQQGPALPPPPPAKKPEPANYCTTSVPEADYAAYKTLSKQRLEKLEKQTRSMLAEYMSVEDHEEVIMCMDELECPAHYKVVVSKALDKGMDNFVKGDDLQRDTLRVSKLLVTLRRQHIDGKTLANALNETAEYMDDIKIDLPRAPSIFKEISSYCLKMPGLLDLTSITPALWACAGMTPPTPEGSAELRLLTLLSTGAVGEALSKKVASLEPAVSGAALMLAVLQHVATGTDDLLSLLEKDDEDDSMKFAPFEEDKYGTALDSVLTDIDPAAQKLAVDQMQLFAFQNKFPTGLLESLFMTAYDEELLVGDAYFKWVDDRESKIPGRIQARRETLAWCTWCKENDDDSDDDSDDDE